MFRDFLYVSILTGGTSIFTATEMLDFPEAMLVSGTLSLIVMFVFERKVKGAAAVSYFLLLLCFYGFWFKVPLMLDGRLNYYLTKAIALVIVGTFAVVILFVERKRIASTNQRRPRRTAQKARNRA